MEDDAKVILELSDAFQPVNERGATITVTVG